MSSAPPSESAYVRAVEAAWARLAGRPVVLSPRDFELVAGWRREGYPLRVVLEVLDHEARRRGGSPRSLRAVAPAVREAAQTVASGRAATPRPQVAAPPEAGHATARWRRALDAAPPAGLRDLLERLLREAAGGAPARELDDTLDRELPLVAPDALILAATEEARRGLEPFKARMEPAEHERAVARGIVDRLRDALDLPRAALSQQPQIG